MGPNPTVTELPPRFLFPATQTAAQNGLNAPLITLLRPNTTESR